MNDHIVLTIYPEIVHEWCIRCLTSALRLVAVHWGSPAGPLAGLFVECGRCDQLIGDR